jgi:hypothetical protein
MLMTLAIFSEGKEYISAIRAAEKSGYTSDYIGQLCRAKKIPSKLVGKTWYIEFPALIEHKKNRKSKKKEPQAISYDHEEFFLLPPLSKKQALPVEDKTKKPRSFKTAVLTLALAFFMVASIFIAKETSFFAFSHSNLAALSPFGQIEKMLNVFADGWNNLKDAAFGKSTSTRIAVTPGATATSSVKISEPVKAVSVTAPTFDLASLRADLKSELEQYVLSRIGSLNSPIAPVAAEEPAFTYNPNLLRREIALADTRPIIARQSQSDANRIGQIVSEIMDGGIFTNATISGANISGTNAEFDGIFSDVANIQQLTVVSCNGCGSGGGSSFAWPWTTLSTNEQATSTTLAFLNGFLSTASSTLTDFTASNSTTTNATSTNLFVSGLASSTQMRTNFLLAGVASSTAAATNLGSFSVIFGNTLAYTNAVIVSGGFTNITAAGSTTLQSFTATNSTTTNATTTNSYFSNNLAGPGSFIVNSSGNVGIGTAAPSHPLHIKKDQDGFTTLAIENGTNGVLASALISVNSADSSGSLLAFPSNYLLTPNVADRIALLSGTTAAGLDLAAQAVTGDVRFYAGGVATNFERMRITSTGRLGLGTTSPIATLDIYASTTDATASFTSSSTAGVQMAWTIGTDLSDSGKFKISSSTLLGLNDRLVIDGNGVVSVGNFLVTGSSTLQAFTASSSTIPTFLASDATTTNFFVSGRASTTDLRANVANLGSLTTNTLTASSLGGSGTRCVQTDNSGVLSFAAAACGSGGAGSAGGTWSTTTSQVAGQFINYSNNNTDIVAIGNFATTSAPYYFDPNLVDAFLTNVRITTSTTTSATTTSLHISGLASTTNLRANSATFGDISVGSCTGCGGSSFAWPFTKQADNAQATSTLMEFFGGIYTNASSTLASTTLTTLLANHATTTNLFVSGLASTTLLRSNSAFLGNLGVGTSTPRWLTQLSGTGAPQLTLSDSGLLTSTHWSFRNSNGMLYLATSSPTTFATTTVPAFMIDGTTGAFGFGVAAPTAQGHLKKDQNTFTTFKVENSNNGAVAAAIVAVNSADSDGSIFALPSNYLLSPHFADRFAVLGGTTASGIDLGTAAATGDMRFFTGGVAATNERMRITNTGLIGIGTTTPLATVDLFSSTTDAAIAFTSSSTAGVQMAWTIGTDLSDSGKFKISSSTLLGLNDRLVIDGNGIVTVQSSSVTGNVNFYGITNDAGTAYLCTTLATGAVSTSTTACNPSSLKYKEKVFDISYGLAEVLKLRPVSYDYKPELLVTGRQVGFIAEEMYEVIPEVVGLKNGAPDNIDYAKLTSVLVKAVKDLYLEFSDLKTKVLALAEKVVSREIMATEKVCIGNTCINEQQLVDLLNQSGQSYAYPSPAPAEPTATSTEPVVEPVQNSNEPPVEPEPSADSESQETQEAEETPEPQAEQVAEATPEPEPAPAPEAPIAE